MMTLGFLLIFFGIQLNVVDSYILSPRITRFLSDNFSGQDISVNPNQAPFSQAGFNNPSRFGNQVSFNNPNTFGQPQATTFGGSFNNRVVHPPGWMGWPAMFLGAFIFLYGVTLRRR